MEIPCFYPITDVKRSGLSHSRQVAFLIECGAKLIQLRDKSASGRQFYEATVESLKTAKGTGALIIINDRVDVAITAGADGVHLGQDDLPPAVARRLLGVERIIGYSTHTPMQAELAEKEPVDYVAIGPVFSTSSKENPDPAIGLATVSQVRAIVTRPLVAIGGITLENASEVLSAGADSVAVISDIYSAVDVRGRVASYLKLRR